MSDAMKVYIQEYLRKEAAVGIVTFNRSAHILANITVVSDNDVREVLSSVLPHSADGGTSISSGLRTCIEVCAVFIHLLKYSKLYFASIDVQLG